MTTSARTEAARGFGLSALFARIGATLDVWGERIDGRRELAELSPREIADAGLDPVDLDREIAKPFWQA